MDFEMCLFLLSMMIVVMVVMCHVDIIYLMLLLIIMVMRRMLMYFLQLILLDSYQLMMLIILVHFLNYDVLLWVWCYFWFHTMELLYERRLLLLMPFAMGLLLCVLLFLLFFHIVLSFVTLIHQHHPHITLRRHPNPIRLLRRWILLTPILLITIHPFIITITVTKLQRYGWLRHVLIPLCLHMRHMTIIIPYLLIMLHMIVPLLWYCVHLLDAFLIAIKWLLLFGFIIVYNIVIGEFPLWRDIGRWWHRTLKVKCDHVQRWR